MMGPLKKRLKDEVEVGQVENTVADIRLGFLRADPLVTHGQLWDCETFFPHGLSDSRFKPSSEDDGESRVHWLESYDAVLLKLLERHDSICLTHVYDDFDDVVDDLESDSALPYNCLWVGSWIFYAVQTYSDGEPRRQMDDLIAALDLFGRVARSKGICLFPPLEYVVKFARKAIYLTELHACTLPMCLNIPPTFLVPLDDRHWREKALSYKDLYCVDKLIFKREISGRGNHVFVVSKKADFPKISSQPLEWIIQPYNNAFEYANEFRMYVVMGVCHWGVATKREKEPSKEVECIRVEPGSKLWGLGGYEAAQCAEVTAKTYAQHLNSPSWLCAEPGKVWFLRVDMVAMDQAHSVWMVNEIEFFGNADLHFECMEQSEQYFDQCCQMTGAYLGSTFADFRGEEILEDLEIGTIQLERRLQRAAERDENENENSVRRRWRYIDDDDDDDDDSKSNKPHFGEVNSAESFVEVNIFDELESLSDGFADSRPRPVAPQMHMDPLASSWLHEEGIRMQALFAKESEAAARQAEDEKEKLEGFLITETEGSSPKLRLRGGGPDEDDQKQQESPLLQSPEKSAEKSPEKSIEKSAVSPLFSPSPILEVNPAPAAVESGGRRSRRSRGEEEKPEKKARKFFLDPDPPKVTRGPKKTSQ